MVKDEIKEIEKKLKKVEKKLKGTAALPEELDKTFQRGTKKIIKILDQTMAESVLGAGKKKAPSTSKLRKGMRVKFFRKKK